MTKLVSLKIDNSIKMPSDLDNFIFPNHIYVEKEGIELLVDHVYKDDYINDAVLSISGRIVGTTTKRFNNKLKETYIIENDFKEQRRKNSKINKNFDKLSKEEFLELLKSKNLNDILTKVNIDAKNIVINAIDEVPYTFNSLYLIKSYTNELLETIDVLGKILDIKSLTIVIKSTNEKSIQNVLQIVGMYPDIKVTLSPDKYLLSKDTFLCNYLKVSSKSTIILTSEDIMTIRNELYKNKKSVTKIITIYEEDKKEVSVINVLLNMSLKELFDEKNIDYKDKLIFINGEMIGYEVKELDEVIIDPSIHSITITSCKKIETECINCGACNRICPKNINVKKHLDCNIKSTRCINCGLCNYICPANINIKKVLVGDDHE